MAASVEGTATCSQPCRLYHWCRHVTRFLLPISISVWAPVSNEKQFATYFNEDYRSFAWVRDPFVCTANELSIDMQEQLIELKSDSRLKELFSSSPLSSFWAALMQEYPELCDVALKILLPFASTYLCEAGFSKWLHSKWNTRNRAQIENDLRLCLSNIEPIIEDLCKAKQAQVSH